MNFRKSEQVEWQAPSGYGSSAATGAEPSGLEGRMSASSSHELTQLLHAWCNGQGEALERLMPLVYEELHHAARRHMAGENSGHTLQTTALVNELYLRLVDFPEISWQDRAHFFAVCSKVMRRILVDFARSRSAQKRGGGEEDLPFDEKLFFAGRPSWDLLVLDEALNRLEAFDARKSQVVEMRFFGGLSVEETAEVLKVSPETVLRDWRLSRVWLFRALNPEARDGA
jgi:RNA polymerase sigma factor (TIGR02999 family)